VRFDEKLLMLLEARIIKILQAKNYEYWFMISSSYRRLSSCHSF